VAYACRRPRSLLPPADAPRRPGASATSSRLSAGARIGISVHVASILGSFRATLFAHLLSLAARCHSRERCIACPATRAYPDRIRGYVCVNPNYGAHARRRDRALSRRRDDRRSSWRRAARADDPLLDRDCRSGPGAPRVRCCSNIWQHRRHDWPGQEASDARSELCTLARRHPDAAFILAHIGGGGDTGGIRCTPWRTFPQRLRRSVGELRGWRHARGVRRKRWGESPALG